MFVRPNLHLFLSLATAALAATLVGCSGEAAQDPGAGGGSTAAASQEVATISSEVAPEDARKPVADAAVEPFQLELLDLAWQAAGKFPKDGHYKNLARAQRQVVETCFEMDLPLLGLKYSRAMDNWRKGLGIADYVHYCLTNGLQVKAGELLEEAEVAANLELEQANPQKWRIDRVLARIAQCHLLVGDAAQAKDAGDGLESASNLMLATQRAVEIPRDSFQQQLQDLDKVYELQNKDEIDNALAILAALYERDFELQEHRDEIESRVLTGWERVDVLTRGKAMLSMARIAGRNGEPERGARIALRYDELLGDVSYKARIRLPEKGRVAMTLAMIPDPEAARRVCADVFTRFEVAREELQSFERAGCIRAAAAAYALLGDRTAALESFTRTLDEGAINPNIRPSINDMVATCTAMARAGFQPDNDMRQRLIVLVKELGA